MTSITEASMIHHVAIVLMLLWLLHSFDYGHPLAYFASLIYLYLIHEQYVARIQRKAQFEERRQSNQRRVLSDSETVRWLNHALEKIWPVCMEEIVSQKILLPIIPWFMEKYKPWTVKQIVVQHLYLGRSPPIFTEMRVLREAPGDDHLVLELGMNFRSADDMSAVLAAKLRRRLGFGIWTKLNMLGMHIEGKVLVGVKFLRKWPFLGRLRVCFAEPPYFQMTVKPIFTHGIDVTELPGVAGWLDNLLSVAFEQTLVEPNMLVVDMEKFVSPQAEESWFSVDAKEPIAHVILEVLEADNLKSADLNGFSDPYVKGHLGPYRFRTRTQKKTLSPQWQEEFKIPVCSWEPPNNMLNIDVRDKDHFSHDDTLGDHSINVCDYRDGQRHDLWLCLQNVKHGRLRLAITVVEGSEEGSEESYEEARTDNKQDSSNSVETNTAERGSLSAESGKKSSKVTDKYEPINIEGQEETGIWVHHPGSEVAQVWEPRKGKGRLVGSDADSPGSFRSKSGGSNRGDEWSTLDDTNGSKKHSGNIINRSFNKIGSLFHKNHKNEERFSGNFGEPVPSPHANIKSVNSKAIAVKLIVDDSTARIPHEDVKESHERSITTTTTTPGSTKKGKVKDKAKSILKQAVSRKSFRKSRCESDLAMSEKNVPVEESDSSDDDEYSLSMGSPLDPTVNARLIASIDNSNSSTVKTSGLADKESIKEVVTHTGSKGS